MTTQQQKLGDHGETIAVSYLEQQGYHILERQWHCPQGEIDIIAEHENMWIFVEVKTRRSQKTADAFASITPQKRERLIAAAYAYLDSHTEAEVGWRIDVIAVAIAKGIAPKIDHVEDALGW